MSFNLMQINKEWWAKNVNGRPVWRVEDLPSVNTKDILLSLNLAYEVRRGTLVLGKPGTELLVLIHSYFWEILSCILQPYAPYAVTGIAAIQCYLNEESILNKIEVISKNSNARIELDQVSILNVEKKANFFDLPDVEKFIIEIETRKKYSLSIESPESLLVGIRPDYFRKFPQVISGFLKVTTFDLEKLQELLLQKSKPITYLRLAALFEQIGKIDEAQFFKNCLKATTHYSLPGKAQIIQYQLPSVIAKPKQKSDPSYVTRFRDQLCIYRDYINEDFKDLKILHWNLKKIQNYAEETKKYDTYHSSTIEGYRVTQEEIQLLMEGEKVIFTDDRREEVERKMALKGYLEAHQFVLQSIEKNFVKNFQLTEFTIREIYAHLFSPTVVAGLLEKQQLIQYRNDSVFIRYSRYVPPNFTKIDDLMRCLVEEVNKNESTNITSAIIAHYGFVTIHPYFDGNGRVARLLMNYMLGCAGIPWITIRVEDRNAYFKALEVAQCDENIKPFSEFVKKYYLEKFSDLN